MARGGALTERASAPLPEYPTEDWTCDCGHSIPITQSPAALCKGQYKHLTCGGYYRPEPGRPDRG